MRTMSYLDAIVEAQREEMSRDDKVFLMGLDVTWGIIGSTINANGSLVDQFGPERVRDAPISENSYLGAGAGAAMVGMRPIIEIEIAPFIYVAMDQLTSIIAKSTYLYGGQASLPITVRMPMMYQVGNAAQHSDRPISALVAEDGFWSLEAPIKRVVTPHTHIPYNRSMEQTLYPTPDRIATAVREVLE